MVVTSTMMTLAENTLRSIRPFVRPYPATINPTSPREIIPTPTRTDSFAVKPNRAREDATTNRLGDYGHHDQYDGKCRAIGPSSRPLACRPIPMKNTGTNIGIRERMNAGVYLRLELRLCDHYPAMYAPVIAATPPR